MMMRSSLFSGVAKLALTVLICLSFLQAVAARAVLSMVINCGFTAHQKTQMTRLSVLSISPALLMRLPRLI